MTDKPKAYAFCEVHFKANCPLCSVTNPVAQPNPDLSAPVSKIPTGTSAGVAQNVPVAVAAPPVLTDPKAQKIVEAARKYASAVEAAAIISDQVAQTRELLAALEKKLEETKKDIEDALKETKTL